MEELTGRGFLNAMGVSRLVMQGLPMPTKIENKNASVDRKVAVVGWS